MAVPKNPSLGEVYDFTFPYYFGVDTTGMTVNIAKGMLKEYLEEKLEAILEKNLIKIIPGFSIPAFILDIVGGVGAVAGYKGINITIKLTYKKTTKHQGGDVYTIEGWKPTGFKLSMFK